MSPASSVHRPEGSDSRSPGTGAQLLQGVAPLLAYMVAFALLCPKWIAEGATSIPLSAPTELADARLVFWLHDWVSDALRFNPAAIYDPPIWFPEKGWLTGCEHFLANQLLYTPFMWLTGHPIVAINLTIASTYPLCAYGTYVLLRAIGLAAIPSFCGGLLAGLGPMAVPSSTHLLQFLAVFNPLIALSLVRLRSCPTVGRAVVCALIMTVATMSSYYTAAAALVVFTIWAALELGASTARARFVGLLALALLLGGAFPIWFTLPYFDRPEVGLAAQPWDTKITSMMLVNFSYHADPRNFGLVGPSFALLGLWGLRDSVLRRYVIGAIALTVAGWLIGSGVTKVFGELGLTGFPGELARFASRFYRIIVRGYVIGGLGIAVLAAIGLEMSRRWNPRLGLLLAAIVTTGLVLTKGVLLDPSMHRVDAFGKDEAMYAEVGRIVGENGGGPLLELPYRNPRSLPYSKAMLGQLVHGVPLIVGHSGYPPKMDAPLNQLIGAFPAPEALNEVMCRHGLRWILLRPVEEWAKPLRLLRAAQGLARADSFIQVHSPDDRFRLYEFDGRCRPYSI